jgi:MscS family membrane protein
MLSSLSEISIGQKVQFVFLGVVIGVAILASWLMVLRLQPILKQSISTELIDVYQKVAKPYQRSIRIIGILAITEALAFLFLKGSVFEPIEIAISSLLTIAAAWFLSRLFKQFFDIYLLETLLKDGRKANDELLILIKISANLIIIILAIIIFAQAHSINIIGLIASLGIGGLAVAFAAQKTLEQILGGIVIYLDRPFVVDDYIGLPDGNFGRVESIGLRSTKIRTSGKGTLVIVPNNLLTQVTVENFTGAKKVMALINLSFHQMIPKEERALVRQIILDSTDDIFGIDTQNTDIVFRDSLDSTQSNQTKVQVTFFILGSGEVSMELRRQLLDIANENIGEKLKTYNLNFDIEEPTIYVDSPITV